MICTMKFIRKERADMEYQNPSYLRRQRAAWSNWTKFVWVSRSYTKRINVYLFETNVAWECFRILAWESFVTWENSNVPKKFVVLVWSMLGEIILHVLSFRETG